MAGARELAKLQARL
uniref:Uncharacterized protein n=1 Tax=Arundo donax TaxID=35708 RepID=A0A0A8YDK0_ARUDO